jgi:hypothetical protein
MPNPVQKLSGDEIHSTEISTKNQQKEWYAMGYSTGY